MLLNPTYSEYVAGIPTNVKSESLFLSHLQVPVSFFGLAIKITSLNIGRAQLYLALIFLEPEWALSR